MSLPLTELLDALEQIEVDIDRDLGGREVRDTHDYTSSAYSAYDDGFNAGVAEATEAFRRRSEAALRSLLLASRPAR